MPSTPSSLIIWLKEWARLQTRRSWLEPRPIYLAAGLTLTVALALLVVSGVKLPPPTSDTAATRQEAAQPAAVSPLSDVVKDDDALIKTSQTPAAAGGKTNEKPRRPADGHVSLAFGWQLHQLYGDWRYHPGVDIAGSPYAEVRAVYSGQVKEVYEDERYGLTVVVEGGGYTVYYGSLAAAKADKGQAVAAGAAIGKVGQAKSEPYPHLHLAVKKDRDYIDPQAILSRAE